MKKISLLIVLFISILACKDKKETELAIDENIQDELTYASYGEKISDDEALEADKMLALFADIKVGDTISAKMKGTINEVCSVKGCWMTLKMDDEHQVRVTFKDYGFFMPLDASGDVVINGKAYVSETSVEDLKHYAEDAGKTEEEIAAITEPKLTYAFEADGVLLKQ
ncbi:MAG: DUF4920 domain-containing protein [Bacteroidia bacterium]|nr:DUF4920 domain-containing protein [Bacteroidia bacterium]